MRRARVGRSSGLGADEPSQPPTGRTGTEARGSLLNLVALSVAAVVGFFLGLLEALERLPYGQTLDIAAVGLAIAVGLGAVLGAFAAPGRVSERVLVSVLRAGLSGAVFAFVFEGMRLLLKIGNVGGAVGAWVWAGILAIVLARLVPAAGRSGR